MKKGKLVISLDFEIYWGVHDAVSLEKYRDNLLGVQKVIPGLLQLFEQYKINATFATVGLLFFSDKKELLNSLPEQKPEYINPQLSPYPFQISLAGENEEQDPLRFGLSLINEIQNAGQEIGCHSFSHYYCLEKGQTPEDFRVDLICAKNIAHERGIELKSFVFPRNQYNETYLRIVKEEGFTSFRGNERSSLFSSKTQGLETLFRRPFRLADAYLNLSGYNCYSDDEMKSGQLINIPSSRFLRPFSKKLSFLDHIKLKRITDSMDYAARNGLTYHLWWHPHNFGIQISENFSFLEKILLHFQKLKAAYNFESMSMAQLVNDLNKEK
jgi:peptidoglycan/xylan/chitin deacetylase (PgdA/CDA1 family)